MEYNFGQQTPAERKPHGFLYGVVGIIVIALAAFVVYLFVQRMSVLPPPADTGGIAEPNFTEDMDREDKRGKLFELVERAESQPLTEDEKEEILREFGGERTASYNLTPEERQRILDALNQ